MMYEELRANALKTLDEAKMAFAYTEISNVFSAYIWYLRSAEEQKALDTLWSERDDIVYVEDGRGYRGQAAVRGFLVEARENMRREKLKKLAELFPDEIKNEDQYLGAGDYEMHWPANSHIRVANDLQTAKGVWWTPGIISEVGADGELLPYFRTVNYGCDFIFENGAWKIWHLREFPEFSFAVDQANVDMTGREGESGAEYELRRRLDAVPVESNLRGKAIGLYSRTRVPASIADIVAPYDTWSPEMSCTREDKEEQNG